MAFILRLLLAQYLVHLFEGITFDAWLNLLRREQFKIDPVCWPRAAWITALSVVNSAAAKTAETSVRHRDRGHAVEAPIFILGHYRSGTTHLHELLATDNRFASPNRYQTFNPRTFLLTERWLRAFGRAIHVAPPGSGRRSGLHGAYPAIAIHGLVLPSQPAGLPSLSHVSRRSGLGSRGVVECLALFPEGRHAQDRPAADSQIATAHSPRAPDSECLPDRSLHSHSARPYTVFSSTMGLLRAVHPVFRLQRAQASSARDSVLETYTEMYEAYFADRALVPPGQLVEIAYEDLERDRLGQLEMIYERLNMGDFNEVRPALGAIPGLDRPLQEKQPSPARRTDSRANRAGVGTKLR